MTNKICIECGKLKKHCSKGMCKKCYNQQWNKNNKDKLRVIDNKSKVKRNKKDACKLIQDHHEKMKDDPESMSTEFLESMIGVECIPLKTGKERNVDIDDVLGRVYQKKPKTVPKCARCGDPIYHNWDDDVKYCRKCHRNRQDRKKEDEV